MDGWDLYYIKESSNDASNTNHRFIIKSILFNVLEKLGDFNCLLQPLSIFYVTIIIADS